MSFEIRINGEKFSLWESASLTRSIESNSGAFRFTSTNTRPVDYPIKKHDAVQIVINGKTKLSGFVDTISARGSGSGQTITVSGRDNTRDLIDSSVPDGAKNIATPTNLKSMCETVISALGLDINVIDNSGASLAVEAEADEDDFGFGENEEIAADSGKNAMDYLVEFARKKQVYLVADGQGNLVIYRPSATAGQTGIVQTDNKAGNNVISYNYTADGSVEYNTYVARSQDNYGADPLASFEDDGVDRKGQSVDSQVPAGRYYEFQSEESMTDAELKQRAEEENNVRRSQGFTYSVDVQGVAQQNGDLWDFGLIVPVRDEIVGVIGLYMIKSVTFSVDSSSGTIATLDITRPEAYKVRGEITQQDKRVAPTIDLLQKSEPSSKIKFTRDKGNFGLNV